MNFRNKEENYEFKSNYYNKNQLKTLKEPYLK